MTTANTISGTTTFGPATTEGAFLWTTNHITITTTTTTTVRRSAHGAGVGVRGMNEDPGAMAVAGVVGAANEAAGAAGGACVAVTFDVPSSPRCKMGRLTATPSCAGWKR